eukprot:scaffold1332_cov42-Attheya_sp.AAC.2
MATRQGNERNQTKETERQRDRAGCGPSGETDKDPARKTERTKNLPYTIGDTGPVLLYVLYRPALRTALDNNGQRATSNEQRTGHCSVAAPVSLRSSARMYRVVELWNCEINSTKSCEINE